MTAPKGSLLRRRDAHEHARVTNIELFFDLVFVFAVTQLSHSLLHSLTAAGAVHVLVLFLGVWWVWIYTSWVTNWLDPERIAVRAALLVLMAAGLVLSASIPEAFERRGLAFALAYSGIQVGRSLFMLWALGSSDPANTRNFQRITLWLTASGILWVAGGVLGHEARLWLWIAAVAVEYGGPLAGFATPGLGRSRTTDWNVEGGHLAERCSLFIIIALGESILVSGASFGALAWTPPECLAFAIALLGSIVMWWIYFDTAAERGSKRISHSSDPGRLGRLAYTYLHLPIVGGIILAAVANELLLSHPEAHGAALETAIAIGGPLVFLIGNLAFKHAITGRWPLSHLAGLALFVAAMPVLAGKPFLVMAAGVTAILLITAIWESRSLRGGWVTPR